MANGFIDEDKKHPSITARELMDSFYPNSYRFSLRHSVSTVIFYRRDGETQRKGSDNDNSCYFLKLCVLCLIVAAGKIYCYFCK
jgi:hypothetical protein